MSPHADSSGETTSDEHPLSDSDTQTTPQVATIRYSKEDLLSLRPKKLETEPEPVEVKNETQVTILTVDDDTNIAEIELDKIEDKSETQQATQAPAVHIPGVKALAAKAPAAPAPTVEDDSIIDPDGPDVVKFTPEMLEVLAEKRIEQINDEDVKADFGVAFENECIEDHPDYDPTGGVTIQQAIEIEDKANKEDKEKKKKKRKKSSGRNKVKLPPANGFEEFYADAPITPEEYALEKEEHYHHTRPFAGRIETCIQRYRAKRKLDSFKSNVFNKYLTLGGIDASAKAFNGGLDRELLEESSAAQIMDITARDRIFSNPKAEYSKYYDPAHEENWVVDFEGVAKCFLSMGAPYYFGVENKATIAKYCSVIRNFLNYVLMHSVCPEYTKDVVAAKMVCDLAEEELWTVHLALSAFPGTFNQAVSMLTDGYYADALLTKTGDPAPPNLKREECMNKDDATRIFKTGMAIMASSEQFNAIKDSGSSIPKVIREERRGFEVVGITFPDEGVKTTFAGTKDLSGATGNIAPLGILEVKHWVNPANDDPELSIEEEAALATAAPPPNEKFWIEDEVLELCFVGMKFEAVVRELGIPGFKYIDYIEGIYPSFQTFLPNMRMLGWRAPEENTREAPSVENPDAEDPSAKDMDDMEDVYIDIEVDD